MKVIKNMKNFLTKEIILYIIVGVVTTLVNIGLYSTLLFFNVEYKLANIISVVISIIVAYILNKIFVFKTKSNNISELFKEIYRFMYARGVTLLLDYFGLIIMVEVFNFNNLLSKIGLTFIVIVLNYILGKKLVFKKTKNKEVNNNDT